MRLVNQSSILERHLSEVCLLPLSLRERHGCPPLEYDEELAKSSQAFANKLAHSPRFKYHYPTDYGENVAYRVRSRDANLTGRLPASQPAEGRQFCGHLSPFC